ncbi:MULTISPECIES: arsenical pump-driving ATPase [unclassified Bacillus (in: firmicutes)]|uniref:arsenical pump-driving ATPase n=1 Tax=unclassified Bacillus (in: firmicutes) TaxID=185979 RepID=UPI0008EFF11C|nr:MULTISPECIES: arsenical pump-driving ATPase [unclassified Bacillus (in: firmicutes)]SFB20437.1 arsenite efflux ATP-binding protein ArsA [Bacillus sp. UNCCL13]SFQ90872.1 arsenite efflux ATP-binding protein ArsA [Bacillus sp. cl95]
MFPLFNLDNVALTPFLFFTGKGGVGKTSTASALAVHLADQGKKVLIVSTDPASNLQDVFEVELSNEIRDIPNVNGLFACNINPEEAAKAYRDRVVGPYRGKLPESVVASMEEQMSGACTVEIAAFDEFTNLLANPKVTEAYDHILFDTAPTGHTLRLLQLPTAWTDFLNESTHGASCLGPLSGLEGKKEMYANTVGALSNPAKTTLFLVARPDHSSLKEAERASAELGGIGINNQVVLVNGVLQETLSSDNVSDAFYKKQQKALVDLPEGLKSRLILEIPLVPFSVTGIESLRKFFTSIEIGNIESEVEKVELPSIKKLVNDLEARNLKVIFTMGKGGVGKTTIASAIAIGLSEKGHRVHLTTTDPAAHLTNIFEGDAYANLTISRIDPKVAVEKYRREVLERVSGQLDENALAYMKEDLESPCTEEIAIFRAFADVVARSKEEIVVIDTAPTGHTLLLLDAAHSYHKELERSTGEIPESVKELLPRLRNPEETEVVIVTLPEATPVFEARRLQEDLKRANINPNWWVINQSLYATVTENKVLKGRAASEISWISMVRDELTERFAVVPWLADEKVGYEELQELVKP